MPESTSKKQREIPRHTGSIRVSGSGRATADAVRPALEKARAEHAEKTSKQHKSKDR